MTEVLDFCSWEETVLLFIHRTSANICFVKRKELKKKDNKKFKQYLSFGHFFYSCLQKNNILPFLLETHWSFYLNYLNVHEVSHWGCLLTEATLHPEKKHITSECLTLVSVQARRLSHKSISFKIINLCLYRDINYHQ